MVALRVRAYFKARLLALLKGHKSQWVVPMQIVRKIGAYAVVIDREQAGIPIDPARPTETEKSGARSKNHLPLRPTCTRWLAEVVSDDGELLGKLNDVLVSDDDPLMRGFEIHTKSGLMQMLGLGDHTERLSARARAVGYVLLVPARNQLVLTSPSMPAVHIEPAPVEALPPAQEPVENQTPEWLAKPRLSSMQLVHSPRALIYLRFPAASSSICYNQQEARAYRGVSWPIIQQAAEERIRDVDRKRE